jgi:hypothetical protein
MGGTIKNEIDRFTYFRIGLIYFLVVSSLVLMTVGLGSAVDNATVDMSKLTAAIEAADTKIGNTVADTDLGQYPQSAINAFKVAIATAQTIANDEDATQEDVNQAVINLEAAEKKFDEAKITTADAPLYL